MTLFRGTFLDTPEDPFAGGTLRAELDGGVLVRDGVIAEYGGFATLRRSHPDEALVDLTGGLVLPGFVDTHVHFPQVRMIGALGMPLLDWLEQSALPEEALLVDPGYARGVAADFLDGLAAAGTTTALVFGSHFAPAMDELFAQAARRGLRITSGLVVSDRILRPDLLTSPQKGYDEGRALAERWHGVGRTRYAVIPRFSLSCTEEMLASCAALQADVEGSYFTSHINENLTEVAAVCDLFEQCDDYLTSYLRHGLVGGRSVYAHNVHATEGELDLLAEHGASVAHCPTSNSALGSGLFPLREHVEHGVRVALGSDVGAGTGFSLFKEGLQAYFMQQLLGARGLPLTSTHLLRLATAAGAAALGLSDEVGTFSVGKQFDALWVQPAPGTTLAVGLRHAAGPEEALARAFALGTSADIKAVFVAGEPLPDTRPGGGSRVGAGYSSTVSSVANSDSQTGVDFRHAERSYRS
jgi:guanine deaminase